MIFLRETNLFLDSQLYKQYFWDSLGLLHFCWPFIHGCWFILGVGFGHGK
jgi:hypothetical protein